MEPTDLTSSAVPADSLKTSKFVVKLVEYSISRGHTLWMDNFYNLPDVCLLLKKSGVKVAGMLKLNRQNVPLVINKAKLKNCAHIAVWSQGMRPMSFISTFKSEMVAVSNRGKDLIKQRGIQFVYGRSRCDL
jgi:hypothetical protein